MHARARVHTRIHIHKHTHADTHTRTCRQPCTLTRQASMRMCALNTCEHATEIASYGLELDANGMPLPRFTNDVTLNRASGGWVKRTLMVCA